MRLTPEQQAEIRERGICANEACDTCGKILGAVRYTRRGEPGEWCSRECRDGVAAVHSREARRAGRPKQHDDAAAKQRAYRSRLRALRNTPVAA
jgi:hypothetical protein